MRKIFENKKKVILVAIVAILALGAFGTYQYNSYKEEQRVKQIEIYLINPPKPLYFQGKSAF